MKWGRLMKVIELKHYAAITEFHTMLKAQFCNDLQAVKVFGSVARGTSREESDIDVFVLIKEKTTAIRDIINDIAFEINLKYDVVLSPIVMSQQHYSNPLFQETLLYKSLQEEGISL